MSTGERPRRRLSAEARREVIERAATEVFAEHGFAGASIEEIARRSGVSPPVVYDHFASKRDLYRRLLERHTGELLALWRETLLTGDAPREQRVPHAIETWAGYVETHPFAALMLFREATGDPELARLHAEIQAGSRTALAGILAGVLGEPPLAAGTTQAEDMEMAAETIRAGLAGLAVWWRSRPGVPRERIVATALDVVWLGVERMSGGERWPSG